MSANTKLVFGTVVITTFAWAVVLATIVYFCNRNADKPIPMGTFHFHPPKSEPIAVTVWPHPLDPSSVERYPSEGEYVARLISTNTTSSASNVLFTYTSRQPEHLIFQTV